MFRSLQVRNFRLFLAGQGVSVAGTWMQNVAVGWLVLDLTHSGGALGLVIAARFVPLLTLGPWGGLVADRREKRRLLRLAASCQIVIATVLGVLTIVHLIAVWSLAALIFAAGLVDVFDTPARQTFINEIVGGDRLGNAIALNSVLVNAARIAGPAAAGVLISAVGVGPCFIVNAASYVAVIAALVAMRPAELMVSARASQRPGQIRAGLRYVWHTPQLLGPLLLVAVSGAFAWEYQVTLPLFTSRAFDGDSRTYGAALASVAAGSIVGGFAVAHRERIRVRTVALSAIAWGTMLGVTSLAPNLASAYALLAVVGVFTVAFNSVSKTVLQAASAEQMRGRVMALWSIGWQGSTVVGAPLVGFVGQDFGARYALGLGGVATLLAGAALLAASRGYTRNALPAKSLSRSVVESETASM